MSVSVETKTNPEIAEMYGALLATSSARLDGLTMEDFQPALGTIVVKQFDPELLTKGGIHLPASTSKKPALGTVVRITDQSECPYEVGDIVILRSENCGTPLSVQNVEYLIVQYRGEIDDEVVGRFPEKKPEK